MSRDLRSTWTEYPHREDVRPHEPRAACHRMRIPGGWIYRIWDEHGGERSVIPAASRVVFVPITAELADEGGPL